MISYCLVAYRPVYAKLLLEELVRKTSAAYEILVWLNVVDRGLDEFIAGLISAGHPVRVIGRATKNIGMLAFKHLFQAAKYEMIVQLDDDVVFISRRIAEIVKGEFERAKDVSMITAHVWQDEYTTGSHPPLDAYRPSSHGGGLMLGDIDGGFSVYRASEMPVLMAAPYQRYFYLGAWVANELLRRGRFGVMSTRVKMFHVAGPVYSWYYGMLDFEIEKYRSVKNNEVVKWYEEARAFIPDRGVLDVKVAGIERHFDVFGAD